MRALSFPLSALFLVAAVLLIARASDPEPAKPTPTATVDPVKTPFPDPINTEADQTSRALPPDEAARGFRVPDGFHVTVFAAEPDVQNPIAMAWDARGRLWIAENYTYADRTKKFDLSLRDRVLILEDVDGDGRFDKRTVFTDDVQMLTGIAIGYDGVWLMTPPQLVYIPDRDRDDKPDGAPIVMLDGFTPATDNHHTFANGLKWGPDGWLYGRCGASSPGRLGIPGTPDEKRVPLFGGMWRFRPDRDDLRAGRTFASSSTKRSAREGEAPAEPLTKLTPNDNRGSAGASPSRDQTLDSHAPPSRDQALESHRDVAVVEVLCHGTTNPWGHDWNEYGEGFFINTVNGHLWQMIPGAHFRRPHSEDPNPYVYSTIDTHADHYHWDTGKDWTDSRNVKGEHDRLGGGHAHSGATVYLGDNWPESYRGRLLTLNLHGRRVNVERLEPLGCGYVGRHEPDMLFAADPWFRGIDLSYGPDGAVYILDWSDTGECHEHTGVHRTSGRIFKVSYGEPNETRRHAVVRDLQKLGSADSKDLVELHRHGNEWFVRQARRVLADRVVLPRGDANAVDCKQVAEQLRAMFDSASDDVLKLRALHTLFSLECDESYLLKQLRHPNPHVSAWAIRLLTDDWRLDTIMGDRHPFAAPQVSKQAAPQLPEEEVLRELIRFAGDRCPPLCRLVLASTLQRLPVDRRLELATILASDAKDADDHDLPLMVWYGVMPVAKSQPESLAKFACACRFPITRRLIARRLAELIDEQPRAVELLLAGADDAVLLSNVLHGLAEGFAGRHKVKPPANWPSVQQRAAAIGDAKLGELTRDLSVLFGDGRALDEVQRVALDGKADLAARRSALQTLIDNRAPNRRAICEQLLGVRYLNSTAIRGLTEFDDASIGDKLAKSYRSFFPSDRPAVIDALVTRPSFAESLLEQIAAGKIPRQELSVVQARQIRSFDNARLTQRLNEVWGELRDSPADKQQLIASLKSQLTAETLAQADKSAGRAVYAKVCANCHRLYGHGGQIGPDLTGSGRQNLDYVLINLVDPSAAVGADYRLSVVVMKDGRVLNGIVAAKTGKVLTLQTAKERLTLDRTDIDNVHASPQSLMPDGLLQPLTEQQVRDLVAYLTSPTQVPLASE
jgi:putative heme-binding domain-containing protein